MKIDCFLFTIAFSIFVGHSNNTILSAFYPLYAEKIKHIKPWEVGFIFGSFSISSFLTSLYLTNQAFTFHANKKYFMITGLLIQGFSQCGFLFLNYLDNQILIIIVAVILRSSMGIGHALFSNPCFALIPVIYKEKMSKVTSIFDISVQLGLCIGPMLGGILFTELGYASCFMYASAISFLPVPFIVCAAMPFSKDPKQQQQQNIIQQINSDLNSNNHISENKIFFQSEDRASINDPSINTKFADDEQLSNSNENSRVLIEKQMENFSQDKIETKYTKIEYLKLMQRKDIVFPFLLLFQCALLQTFLEPNLAPFAYEEYGMDSEEIGFVFFLGAFIFLCSIPIATSCTIKTQTFNTHICIGSMLAGFSLYLIGQCVGLGKKQFYMFLGVIILNVGSIFVYTPFIPAIVFSVQQTFQDIGEEQIADISSGLFNSAFSLGGFMGPVLGSAIVNQIGFRETCFYIGTYAMTIALLYYILKTFFFKSKIPHSSETMQFNQSNSIGFKSLHSSGVPAEQLLQKNDYSYNQYSFQIKESDTSSQMNSKQISQNQLRSNMRIQSETLPNNFNNNNNNLQQFHAQTHIIQKSKKGQKKQNQLQQ